MERALAIPELLGMILRYADKASQTSANLVCKAWSKVATAALWEDNVPLHSLLKNLCGEVPCVPIEHGPETTPDGFALLYQPLEAASDITLSKWQTFENLTKSVRDLLIKDDRPFPHPTAIPQVLELAQLHDATLPLFPRLQSILADFDYCPSYETILFSPILYPHTLHTFDVSFPSSATSETLERCLRLLGTECPDLRALLLHLPEDVDLRATQDLDAYPAFRGLTYFSTNSIRQNLLEYISKVPELQCLSLTSTGHVDLPDFGDRMLSLQDLSIRLDRGPGLPLTRASDILSSLAPGNLSSLRIHQRGAEEATDLQVLVAKLPDAVPRLLRFRLTLGNRVTVTYEDVRPLAKLHDLEAIRIDHDNSPGGFVDLRMNDQDLLDFTAALPNLIEFEVQTASFDDSRRGEGVEAEAIHPQPPLLTPIALWIFTKYCPGLRSLKIRLDFTICTVPAWDRSFSTDGFAELEHLDLTDSWFCQNDDPLFRDAEGSARVSSWQRQQLSKRVMTVTDWLMRVVRSTGRTKVTAEGEMYRWWEHMAWSQVRGAFLMERSGEADRTFVERYLTNYIWCARNGRTPDPRVQMACDDILEGVKETIAEERSKRGAMSKK